MDRHEKMQDAGGYKMKSWVDAMDKGGVWRVGRVKNKEDDRLLVVFDGWSEKHSQVHVSSHKKTYCEHSDKLAPLRMHTRGIS